jgi:hypothetical protein
LISTEDIVDFETGTPKTQEYRMKTMNKSLLALTLAVFALSALPAHALPRDAEAVLNRCGQPLQGEEIVYDNSITGGHRTLKYERGTLLFDRFENKGWTFHSGSHRKLHDLNADQMAEFMPCIKDAMADSAAPEPIKQITSVQRVEVSLKRAVKTVIMGCMVFLAVLGVFLFWLSKRPQNTEGMVG